MSSSKKSIKVDDIEVEIKDADFDKVQEALIDSVKVAMARGYVNDDYLNNRYEILFDAIVDCKEPFDIAFEDASLDLQEEYVTKMLMENPTKAERLTSPIKWLREWDEHKALLEELCDEEY